MLQAMQIKTNNMLVLKNIIYQSYSNYKGSLSVLSHSREFFAHFSTSKVSAATLKVKLDNDTEKQIMEKQIKPRKHKGICKTPPISIPERIVKAMPKVIGDFPMKTLCDNSAVLDRYIKCRKAPIEEANMKQRIKEIEELVLADPIKYKLPKFPQNDDDNNALKLFHSRKNQTVKAIVKQRIYSWKAINYDDHQSLLYLFGRSAQEYAAIMKIFIEILKREPDFMPQSFFDFGSGVGTGAWAAHELWRSSLHEYYCVDASAAMNNLADLLLRDGDMNKTLQLKNIYFRQFLPASNNLYDIVLSAYSMFELPDLRKRLEVAKNLYKKSANYLVFVEVGTYAGFQVLSEIREYLVKSMKINEDDAFIFSPCPHESSCPRLALHDNTPCNFSVAYQSLPFSGPSLLKSDVYSYLVIKKGKLMESKRWPRIVRSPLIRHRHVVCRMCTENGKIEEGIFTPTKHGKAVYKCAKASQWGDRLPVQIMESDESFEPDETSKNNE
ncbi:CLUMA_CG014346, isoform A [Clunio marinus]|uniref:CLUMA_CG014346, isoform A n=1 Tax=Clunio marinus TaxID=568069 RepID=A0A1J1IL91_9DIPT|nr:CLUMA_CG014346, isoform A [Clunio marinus]